MNHIYYLLFIISPNWTQNVITVVIVQINKKKVIYRIYDSTFEFVRKIYKKFITIVLYLLKKKLKQIERFIRVNVNNINK